MIIPVDTHTHSVASGHGFSTLHELIGQAKQIGLPMFAFTEHGPAMPGGPPPYYFSNLYLIPREKNGVRIIRGAEANIVDLEGNIDLEGRYLEHIEYMIASQHTVCMQPGTPEQNTECMVAALENPYVDTAGHPGNPSFDLDPYPVVMAAKKYDKLIEINNHSFLYRKGSGPKCAEFARLCAAHDVRIAIGSDAHIQESLGVFTIAIAMLEELAFPQELIVNATPERFCAYLDERVNRLPQQS
ncbi:MAG: phosphatase [Christensenellales bacterium]|jgi:putative hydrolase